jgi:hypothetical protein
MRSIFIISCFILGLISNLNAQSVQDFGTTTETHSTGASTTFIPNPTVSGSTYVRVGTAGGSINKSNSPNPLGTSGVHIRASAPTTASVNKFSPVLAATAGKVVYSRYKVLFGDASGGTTATTGTWYMFLGDGATFSDANSFTGTQSFVGLRFTFGTGGTITLNNRAAGNWNTTGLSTSALDQGIYYNIEIVGNNQTSGSLSYTYNGIAQTTAINTIDLYFNGVLVGNDIAKAQLANNADIRSIMFYGESSTGNAANIFLDDVTFQTTAPTALGGFTHPTPYDLSLGSYTFTNWPTTSAVGSYPSNMVLHWGIANITDPSLAQVNATQDYVWGYNYSSQSRINGQAANGLSFINTNPGHISTSSGNLGEAVVGVNTTGRNNVAVSWTAARQTNNGNRYLLRGQYRIGTTGSFTDLPGTTAQIEFNSTNAGPTNLGPITLPVACENQPNVQVRWVYSWIGSGSGSRDEIRLDDITISSSAAAAASITTGTVTGTICAGATGISVPFTYTPSASFPNGTAVFTAQLSDASGSFASPTNLQTVTSNASGSQSMSVTIPALTATGSGYRIRVVSASPTATGSINGANIQINNASVSIAPIASQSIGIGVNGTTLTSTEGSVPASRQWLYSNVSGGPYTNVLGTASTYTPNFLAAGNYYIVCRSTFGAPCSNILTSNEVLVTVNASLATLTTTSITSITNLGSSSGGNISSDGGSAVSGRGIVWNTTTTPVLPGLGNTSNGTGTGTFTSALSSISAQTRYYVRAYATNGIGTAYGNELNFYTLSNPPEIQASNLIANAISTTQLDLSWDAAQFPASGATVKGYILLRATSPTLPTLTSINSQAPVGGAGTTIVSATIAEGSTTFSNTLLSSSTNYNYLLVPFCWDGTNAATYNYLTNLAPDASGTTLTGTCAEPTVGATAPFTSGITATQITLSTSSGNGNGRLAIVSTSPIVVVPTNGTTYISNAQFGLGDNLGSFTYAVYSGSSNNVTVTGLNPSTTYYFAVYEYNTAGQCYKITSPGLVNATTLSAPSIVETFEPGTKAAYTVGNDNCNLGSWNFSDALVGTDANDRKIGAKAARIRNTGSVTMNFDKTNGAGTVQVSHAKYGTDANSTWRLEVSTNGGASFDAWVSSVITTSSTTLSTQSFAVNQSGSIRLRIAKLSGGSARLNVDNISISDFISTNTTSTGTIVGSPFCISEASGISVNVPYTATGTFNSLNVFTAQLSDASGSFAIPTDIGTITGSALTGTISGTIPAGTPSGTGYRIRVITSEPITPIANVSQNSSNLSVFLNAPDVVGFNGTVLSGTSVQLAWTLPAGCYDELLIVGRNGSAVSVNPTGNGSLYTANSAFGTVGTDANLAAGQFAVFKAASGSTVTLTGLTAGATYYFEIFTRKNTNWSDGVILSIEPNNTQIGDFRSTASGNWNSSASWQRWSGSSWINCNTLASPNQWPNQGGTSGASSTINVSIQSSHTITLSTSATSQAINNLTVNAGGKLYTNNTALNGNRYLTIYGDIKCNGEIGNGSSVYDNISFNIEGNPTTISGTGTFNASRLRKNFSANATSNLIIAMNVGLRFAAGVGNSSGTQIYNNIAGTVFNMTVNENVTVTLNKDVGLSGNLSVDGIDGEGAGERGGTFNINGTLNIPGTLFVLTDNVTSPVAYVIGTSGVVNCVSVCTGNSASTGNGSLAGTATLRILNGGKLNMTDNKPFNIRNNTVSPYTYVEALGTVNNTFDLQPGSIVQFSSPSGTQPINTILTYSNLLLTSGANKTIAGTLNVLQDITMESPSIFIPQGNNVNVGGDWRNYGETGFTEGTSGTIFFNGTAAQNIYSLGGEFFYNVTISNSSLAGVTLRDNITLANDLDLGAAGKLYFGVSPAICTLSKMTASSNTFKGSGSAMVDMSQAEHTLIIGCENPSYSGGFTAGSLSLVTYNRTSASAVSGNQNVLCNISYANLSLSGSDNKYTNDHFTVNQTFVVDGSNTVLEATVVGKTLTLGGNLTLSGGATMNDNCRDNLEIVTTGNASQVFNAQTKNIKCFNLKSTKTSGGISLTGPEGQTETNVKNDFALDYSGSALFSDNINQIKVGDDVELGGVLSNAANFNLTGTLELNGQGATVDVHISDFAASGASKAQLNNLTINTGDLSGSLKTVQTYPTGSGALLVVKGNLTIVQGTNGAELESNSNQISVGGNWTNWNASAFKQGTGNVTLNGNAAQLISCSGGENFYSFTLNNSSASGIQLIGGDLFIEQQISFTDGLLDLNSNNLLLGTISTNATVLGGSSNSYAITWDGTANGKIIHRVNTNTDAYYFPMGDLTVFSPATIDLNSGLLVSSRLEGSVIPLAHPQLGSSTNYLNRYWLIEPVGITNPNYNVSFSYGITDATGPENTLYPAKFNTGGWQTPTGSGSLAMIGTGSVNTALRTFSWNGLIDFSEFTGLGNGSPLPIELLSFDATMEGSEVQLNWTTASEINNAWFEVERSQDAVHFKSILKQAGAGNSSLMKHYSDKDKYPFDGVSYYRLKQTDFNGSYSYSEIVPVQFDANNLLLVSANHLENSGLQLLFNQEISDADFRLFDLSGKLVYSFKLTNQCAVCDFPVNTLNAGIYLLEIQSGNKRIMRKINY